MQNIFLQLNTFFTHGYAWLRLVTLCHELLYFLGFVYIPSLCLLLIQSNTNSQSLTLTNPWPPFEITRSLGCVRLGYVRLMYHILRCLVMDGHASLSLTSLSLLYRFVNVLYLRTLFLLLNTFCHGLSRILYIVGFDLYTVSMTLVYAT